MRPLSALLGLALASLAALAAPAAPIAVASAAPFCAPGQPAAFQAGFGALADHLGGIMGAPLECEHAEAPGGDVLQQTSTGLAFYRRATNTPTFTDGHRHWALVGGALVVWEGPSVDPPSTAAAVDPRALATRTESGWATVVDVLGPEALRVTGAGGETFDIWHIGVIGATGRQGDWRARGAEVHAGLLPAGARVWLQAEAGLAPWDESIVFRHVQPEGPLGTPLGGELLRRGVTWVFPHTRHAHMRTYAARQAEAVEARAGMWGQSRSSAVYRLPGQTEGGFPADPRALPLLRAMATSEFGRDLLLAVSDFPVEIGVARLPGGVLGSFQPRVYTVQVAESVLDAPPAAAAAVLVHELTHARQMIAGVIDQHALDCFGGEEEAFAEQSRYWAALHGPSGRPGAAHWLERQLNLTLRQVAGGQIGARVHETYAGQCAGR